MNDGTRHSWILGAVSCVLGLVVLDETVVGVALPTIRHDLTMSQTASHWVVNAYLLMFTCFAAVGGRLSDMFERRIVFAVGAGIFAVGSLAAGAAPSGGWLIAARALQGMGAAISFPASFAILTATFPPERRGAAFGIQSTIAGKLRDQIGARRPLLIALLVTAATILVIGAATIIKSHLLIAVTLIVWGAFMPGIAVSLRPALMGAVPAESQGQASGVNLSIQMLGGTFGIAVCSVLLASTKVYWPVFLVTGCVTLFAALIAWLMVERPGRVSIAREGF